MTQRLSINGSAIGKGQIKSVKMYVSIVKYANTPTDDNDNLSRRAAKHIVDFMRSVYLCEHPSDELDLLDGRLTDACKVVNTVSLNKYDSLRQLISLSIDFDNMLSLGYINYAEYISNTLKLSKCQQTFIEDKQRRLIVRHSLTDYALTASNIDDLFLLVQKPEKRVNQRAVRKYDLDGNLLAEYESVSEAARASNINWSNVSKCCNKKQLTAKGFIFRFADDESPIEIKCKQQTLGSGRDSQKRRVVQFDLSGNLIAVFNSVGEAAEAVSGSLSNIIFVCNNQRKSAYGFVWRYADDDDLTFNNPPAGLSES